MTKKRAPLGTRFFLQLLLLSKQPQNILYGIDHSDAFAGFEF